MAWSPSENRSRSRFRGCQVLLATLGGALLAVPATGQAPAAVPVSLARVVQRDVQASQSFVGTVVAIRTSTVGSPVDQRLEKLLVNEGDAVVAGQPLAELRTTTLRIQLAAARADLDLRRQELAELENGTRPEEIEAARARLAAAQALAQWARIDFERTEGLYQRKAASQDEFDRTRADAHSKQSDVALREAELRLLVNGARPERIAQARARLQSQEQEVARIEEELDRHTIRSPFDGFVVAEYAEVGQWAAKGSPIVQIVDLGQVEVEVLVPEHHVSHLTVGTPAQVEVESIPRDIVPPEGFFLGKVSLIIPRADPRSRTFPVKVRLSNRSHGGSVLLKAGMFARVRLPVGKEERAILVPKDALVLAGPAPIVYVFQPQPDDPARGKVHAVPVKMGVGSEDRIVVQGDLRAGQYVVAGGNERLREGQEVVSSPASRPADSEAGAAGAASSSPRPD